MRKSVYAVTIAAAAVIGCRRETAYTAPKATQLYVDGATAYRSGDRDSAKKQLVAATQANSNLRMARSLLGDLYRDEGNYNAAVPQYEALVRLDPYSVSSHYRLGVAYQMVRRLDDAANTYRRAIVLDPNDYRSNMNLGLVYLSVGRIDDAVQYLERATRIQSKAADAWSNLAVALDARGSYVLAEGAYRKALELDGSRTTVGVNLANNLVSQNKSSEAVTLMEQLLRDQSADTPAARAVYGAALGSSKRYEESLNQFDMALRATPNFYPALNSKGFTLIKQYEDGAQLDEKLKNRAVDCWRQSLKIMSPQPAISEAMARWQKSGLLSR